MAVLSKNDLMKKLQTMIGDNDSDEALAFLEDVTDTFEDLSKKEGVSSSNEWEAKYKDMEQKYNNLDKEWREKYKSRFFEGSSDNNIGDSNINTEPEGSEDESPENFDDLFEESEV